MRRQLGITERVSEVKSSPLFVIAFHLFSVTSCNCPLPPAPFPQQAGMAQIRQLASLLSQQQQQVLPPFLSHLHSPAPRAAPPPQSPAHSAAAAGESGGGDRGQPAHSSSSGRVAAAVCSAEQEGAARAGGAARAMATDALQPSTPQHRPRTPPLQPPALVRAEDGDLEGEERGQVEDGEEEEKEEEEEGGQQLNVSGSSDGSCDDA